MVSVPPAFMLCVILHQPVINEPNFATQTIMRKAAHSHTTANQLVF